MNGMKFIRMEMGISQWQLSKMAKVPRHVISLCEHYGVAPIAEYRKKIAKYLDTDAEELFNEVAKRNKKVDTKL